MPADRRVSELIEAARYLLPHRQALLITGQSQGANALGYEPVRAVAMLLLDLQCAGP